MSEIKKQEVQASNDSDSRADATAIFFMLMIALASAVFWVSQH